jgi:hypothetical protein
MALSLEQLKAAFKQPERSGNTLPNNYYPFWNMKNGEQAIVRFLPDKDSNNPLGFLVERLSHALTINGERKTIPCLRMYGEDCPICAVSAAYYKDGDKENGKKYWRKKSHIAQALIVEDPLDADDDTGETAEGKVKFISLSYQLYNVIKDAFESGELEEVPFAYENGCNFIIKKTQQGDYPNYTTGSKFARNESDLTADEIEYVEEQLAELSTLLPANPGREKVEAMLEAALTGGEYVDDNDSASSKPAAAPKAEAAPAPKKEEVTEDTSSADSDDSGDADGEDILAAIRARRAERAS